MDDDALLERAAAGDRAAAGAYLARHLPALAGAARRLAGDRFDPEDLLADAVIGLLERWSEGEGPVEGARGYLLQSMRNRVVDHTRSPWARMSPLEPGQEPVDLYAPEHGSHLELEQELHWLGLALARLPEPQRDLLMETVGGGRRVGTVGVEQGRSSMGAYAASSRARRALRRAYLQVILEEGAPPSCQLAIAELPQVVGDALERTPGASRHLHDCGRCRRRWSVFAMGAGSFGLLPLLALQGFGRPVLPIEDPRAEGEPASQGASMIPAAASAATAGAGAGVITPKLVLVAGGVLLSLGAVLSAVLLMLQPGGAPSSSSVLVRESSAAESETPSGAAESSIVFGADPAGGRYSVDIAIVVPADQWTLGPIEFGLPEGLLLAEAPDGYLCDGSSCTTETDADGGIFHFEGRPEADGILLVRWSAETADERFSGEAGAPLPRPGQRIGTVASA